MAEDKRRRENMPSQKRKPQLKPHTPKSDLGNFLGNPRELPSYFFLVLRV